MTQRGNFTYTYSLIYISIYVIHTYTYSLIYTSVYPGGRTTPGINTKYLVSKEQISNVNFSLERTQSKENSSDYGKYSRGAKTDLMEGFRSGGLWWCYS